MLFYVKYQISTIATRKLQEYINNAVDFQKTKDKDPDDSGVCLCDSHSIDQVKHMNTNQFLGGNRMLTE